MEQPIRVAAANRPRLMREIDLTAPSDQPDTEFSAKWRTRPIFGRVTTRSTFWYLSTFQLPDVEVSEEANPRVLRVTVTSMCGLT